MGRYGIHFVGFATATAIKTAATIAPAATNVMAELLEAIMTGDGATGTADIMHAANLAKLTLATAGTGTAVTPDPNDDASNAARSVTKTAYSAEPTAFATVFPVSFGFYQRSGMRWAQPRGDGIAIYQPLTNKALGFQVKSSAAGTVQGSMGFYEP